MSAIVNKAIEYRQVYSAVFNSALDFEVAEGEETRLLEEIERDIQRHAAGYASIIRQIEADAKTCQQEAKDMANRAESLKRKAEWLKGRVKTAMELIGATKIECSTVTVAIQDNGGVLPVVISEDKVPKKYMYKHIEERIDRDKIRSELEAGKSLPFAMLGERGSHLRIRVSNHKE